MSLPFAFLVAVVFFVVTPSLESIGARAQTLASEEQCATACGFVADSNPDSLERLIMNNNIDVCDCVCDAETGEGLYHVAARFRCGHCVDILNVVPNNCPCDFTDFVGNSPLHFAASNCSSFMTERFLNASCNANAQNEAGETPLCLVSSRMEGSECGGTVNILVNAGADACIADNNGMTACDKCGFPGTCDVLYKEPETCDCVTPPL
eukprot:g378.t1